MVPRLLRFRPLQQEDENAGGDSDAQRHSHTSNNAEGDSTASNVLFATLRAAEREATEEKVFLKHFGRFPPPSPRCTSLSVFRAR